MVPPGDAASSIIPIASSGGEVEQPDQAEADQRQQHELTGERDSHGPRRRGDPAEVVGRQRQAEPEHDDPERQGEGDRGERGVHARTLVTAVTVRVGSPDLLPVSTSAEGGT